MYILIVEDNQELAELISESLSDKGYNTAIAYGGNEAISVFENKVPDMFILDYSLPDMDGKQLITALREGFGGVPPFIVSTGRGDEQVAVDMMKLGAYDYLIKESSLISRLPDVVSKIIKELEIKKLLKEAEVALKESENRFRSFVENSSDLFIKLSEEGNFVYLSPNCKELLGYHSAELIGKPLYEIVSSESRSQVSQDLKNAISNINKTTNIRYSAKHKDGGIRYHSAKGISLIENEKIYANFVVRDITEKTLADNRILNAIIQTEENQRKLLAEELHEGIGPNLSALLLYMDRIKNIAALSEKEKGAIEICDKLVNDSVNKVRQIANKLMPTVLNDFGLIKALGWLIEQNASPNSLKVEILSYTSILKIGKMTEIVIYRLIEDLIINSQRHSQANNINITIDKVDSRLLIAYHDSGCYIDRLGSTAGIDLAKHQSRIASLNGNMEYLSPNGQGLKVQITLSCPS